jgi:arylsulfatase
MNIVFILLDQMRWDCMGIAGHPVVETPNMDRLGRRGTVFTSAYSTCPSCIAARASMMTGLTPSTHGRLGYQDGVPWRYDGMLAELLSRAGYQTHCVGKTHFYPQRTPCGFQTLDSYEARQNLHGDYVNDYWEWLRDQTDGQVDETTHGLGSNSWVARPSHVPEELHVNTWTANQSIAFMEGRDKSRPFFLNVSFHRPHAPLDPPQRYWDMYVGRELPPVPIGDWAGVHDVPVDGTEAWHGHLPDEDLDRARWGYYAQVAHVDAQIGRIVDAVERMDAGPTAFLLTADHGEMLGDHHMFRKCYAYEGSAAVPFIVALPEGSEAQTCDAPVALEDVYPTVLEMASLPIPARTEGASVLPLCRTESDVPWRSFVHGEHSGGYDDLVAMQYLTDGREKFVWLTCADQEQLFDLVHDPQELHDRSGDADAQESLKVWRARLIDILARRPQDGLTDGHRLIPGKLPAVRPELLA